MFKIHCLDNPLKDHVAIWSVDAYINSINPATNEFMHIAIGTYESEEYAEAVLNEIEQGIQNHVEVIRLKEKQISQKVPSKISEPKKTASADITVTAI